MKELFRKIQSLLPFSYLGVKFYEVTLSCSAGGMWYADLTTSPKGGNKMTVANLDNGYSFMDEEPERALTKLYDRLTKNSVIKSV